MALPSSNLEYRSLSWSLLSTPPTAPKALGILRVPSLVLWSALYYFPVGPMLSHSSKSQVYIFMPDLTFLSYGTWFPTQASGLDKQQAARSFHWLKPGLWKLNIFETEQLLVPAELDPPSVVLISVNSTCIYMLPSSFPLPPTCISN